MQKLISIFIIALFTVLSAACSKTENSSSGSESGDKSTTVTIKGVVTDPGTPAELNLRSVDFKAFKAEDFATLTADAEGAVSHTFELEKPTMFLVNKGDKQIGSFELHKGGEITLDMQEDGTLKVSGSKASERARTLIDKRNELQEKYINPINEKGMQAQKSGDTEALAKLREEYVKAQDQYITTFSTSLEDAGALLTTLTMLQEFKASDHLPLYEALYNDFQETMPGSDATTFLKEKIETAKTTSLGAVAPNIELANPEGEVVELESLRGQYVLIEFWASWCGPCRKENPNVVEAYKEFKDKDFTVYGVSLDNDKEKWVKAIEKDNLTWPHVSDLKGWKSAAGQKYGVSSIPYNLLIDKEGKILAKNLRGEELHQKLKEVLGS